MEKQFEFCMPTKVCFGTGASKEVKKYIKDKKVLIISDPFLYQSGIAKQIGESMKDVEVTYFSEVEPNPTCESVDKAADLAREMNVECVIGLGGGSALDISKMVSCLVTNQGSIYDYYSGGDKTLSKRKTTLICIPTTAGTGSEVTNVAVFTNEKTGVKMPMVNNEFWADFAVIDPELTYTLPPSVTAATGMDAFCHAIEAYWNKASQPMCDLLAMGAMKKILKNLKLAFHEPGNKQARAEMIEASLIAGVAFSQTRTTGVHALSFPLTAEFGASHGTACAITLPAFIKLSKQQAKEKMMELSAYLGYQSIEDLADAVEALMKSMNMPVRLHEIGVKETDIEHIAEVGLNAAVIHLTPAEMNKDTVCNLLKSIL